MELTDSASGSITAVIADDEPLLAESLARDLLLAWPELSIVATSANGTEAISSIKKFKPDIAFLDIRMPGATGIEVAEAIAEDWPDDPEDKAPPLVVFVTAYDDYALQAFATAAIDYLLKPVKTARLAQTIERLKQRLIQPETASVNQLGEQIKLLLATETERTHATGKPPELHVIRASIGDVVRMIPVDEVVLFESADKYVSVYTPEYEALIREPLRKLLPQLDQSRFAQIHRGAIVNLNRVEAAVRDESGKVTLRLKGHDKQPVVSRLYRHLFQAM